MPRAVAQLGSALDWGSRGRRFKSCQPDWDVEYVDTCGTPFWDYSSQDQLEDFQARWAARGLKLDMGKSCIRFKAFDDLPADLIAEVIRSKTPERAIDMISLARG